MSCGNRDAVRKRWALSGALMCVVAIHTFAVPAPAHSGATYRGVIAIHGCRSAIIESADPVHVLARTEVDEGNDVLEDAYWVMKMWFGLERHEIIVREVVSCK